MKLREMMSRDIKTVEAQATIAEAARLMKMASIGILPVMGAAQGPIGVITDRDIAIRSVADGLTPQAQVREVMTPEVYMVNEEQDLQVALDLMKEKKIGRAFVCDKNGGLVGVVSLGDAAICCGGDGRTAQVSQVLKQRTTKSPEVRLL